MDFPIPISIIGLTYVFSNKYLKKEGLKTKKKLFLHTVIISIGSRSKFLKLAYKIIQVVMTHLTNIKNKFMINGMYVSNHNKIYIILVFQKKCSYIIE